MRCIRVGLLCAAVCVAAGPAGAGQSAPGAKTGKIVMTNGKGGKTKGQDPFNQIKGGKEKVASWLKGHRKRKNTGNSQGNPEKPWHILPSW